MAEFTFTELTPTAFLDRTACVFRDQLAVIDGQTRLSYAELRKRSHQLAGALTRLGIEPGDRVATLCTNSHVLLEAHHGAPLAGAVLVPLNIRLAINELSYIVEHSGARVLLATHELSDTAQEIADAVPGVRIVVSGKAGDEYEELLSAAELVRVPCADERGLLAINYTSGTTGEPKGVMYHHRGAYLQALSLAFHCRLGLESRYLWTLPMFHCNGWCFPWAVTAAGATHVCLRAFDPVEVWKLISREGVTHLTAAPTVLTMIANAREGRDEQAARTVHVTVGGAPPSPTLLSRLAQLRMQVTHLYGLTETFGPIAVNDWQPQWDELPETQQAELKSRQGVGHITAEQLRVVTEEGTDVPADGETMGELICRGNAVMLGYYRDQEATQQTTLNGWYRTGDLAVLHPDGYVEIRDRRKDIIISGGENIASVEVERVLDSHPAVLESALVAQPDNTWGETPIAYVTLRGSGEVSEQELIDYVRARLARFKAPRRIVLAELPKTSTGKIQKNVLRERAAQETTASP